jgi:hypothetical protein
MDKKLLYGVGIGALIALVGYHLFKKPSTINFNASTETTDKISSEIIADANVEKVQPELPQFGVPRQMISFTNFANANGFKNYVDVKNNQFFKPELGAFHK